MARAKFQPAKPKLNAPQIQPREPILIAENRVNGGMNTFVDPADLSSAQLTLAKNIRTYADRTFRRPGTIASGPTKPNSNRILLYTLATRFDGTGVYLRFDKSKLYRQGVASWTEITGAGYTMTDSSRPGFITINDRFFFATGVDPIKEINFAANTYATLGNAPKYKYMCGFFNRIVGANLYDSSSPNPVQVGWSGDLNFGVWDSATDISAGSTPLVEAQADFADPITGLFGFAQVMLILRERSLWLVTKQPSASDPFQFQASFPTLGCDTPASATQKRNGIIWYDRRTNQIFDYTIGQAPVPIGDGIRSLLGSRVTGTNLVQGTYDPINDRYHLLIFSNTSSTTTAAVYDFRTQSWSYDEFQNLYSISALDASSSGLMIDDLAGTIDDLVGFIDDLVNSQVNQANVYYGSTTGELYEEDNSVDTDSGAAFTMEMDSKVFNLPASDISVSRLLFKLDVRRAGSFNLEFSRDAGSTWTAYKTVTLAELGRHIITAPKQITTSEYAWRITSTEGLFDILEYRVEGFATALTKPR
jgi:hypothetical protein